MKIKRIYDKPSGDDGYRVLVDRLWCRGISKENAKLDEWNKEIAPSTELRKWFNHEEKKFPEFKQKYIEELESSVEKQNELKRLKDISKNQNLTLLYGAKDEKLNQAVILLELISEIK